MTKNQKVIKLGINFIGNKNYMKEKLKETIPLIKPGMILKIYYKIKEKSPQGKKKERSQFFEGIVIARRHDNQPQASVTLRKISHGVGIEKTFPLFSPLIEKIEIIKKIKVRKAKAYYLRGYKKKLKEIKNEK